MLPHFTILLFLSLSFYTKPGATVPYASDIGYPFSKTVEVLQTMPGNTGYLNCYDGILCEAGGWMIDEPKLSAEDKRKKSVNCETLKKKAISYATDKKTKEDVAKHFFEWNRHLLCTETNLMLRDPTHEHPHTFCWKGKKHLRKDWDEDQVELCNSVFAKNDPKEKTD